MLIRNVYWSFSISGLNILIGRENINERYGRKMTSKAYFKDEEIKPGSPGFSRTRSIIETTFYGNNVVKINSLKEAYELASGSPGTTVTGIPVYGADEMGLPADAKVLLFNDGSVVGRYAPARRLADIVSKDDKDTLDQIVMDAVYDARWKKLYHAEAVIGLEQEFMVKAHMLIPEGEENILYSWLLNFQHFNDEYKSIYDNSKAIGNGGECDVFIFSDPHWKGTGGKTNVCDPNNLCYFNTQENCGAILGMRYFGEHKKGTLTLAWTIAARNGFIPCHGGQKEYVCEDGSKFAAAFFGLSGSGKSTLTHAQHAGKYDKIRVLHDDAFIINEETKKSIALEPAYFDKTADYCAGSEANNYLLTVQNCGATVIQDGTITIVSEDIRNRNGRAIKSKFWSANRVNKIDHPLNAVFWIMKDPTLPPVLKITDAVLAAVMGVTLTTQRSSAERVKKGAAKDKPVIEPYANPFRAYPLVYDYEKFKQLFYKGETECFIINTGQFMGKDIKKEDTLEIIEMIIDKNVSFKTWGQFEKMETIDWMNFKSDFNNREYIDQLKDNMRRRLEFVEKLDYDNGGYDRLPMEVKNCLKEIIEKL